MQCEETENGGTKKLNSRSDLSKNAMNLIEMHENMRAVHVHVLHTYIPNSFTNNYELNTNN